MHNALLSMALHSASVLHGRQRARNWGRQTRATSDPDEICVHFSPVGQQSTQVRVQSCPFADSTQNPLWQSLAMAQGEPGSPLRGLAGKGQDAGSVLPSKLPSTLLIWSLLVSILPPTKPRSTLTPSLGSPPELGELQAEMRKMIAQIPWIARAPKQVRGQKSIKIRGGADLAFTKLHNNGQKTPPLGLYRPQERVATVKCRLRQ